jgi:hypothetical protein
MFNLLTYNTGENGICHFLSLLVIEAHFSVIDCI